MVSKGTKRSVTSIPPLGDTKTCQKSHFWGTFWHFKPKRSSALKMEYPKKVSFFLAEISNLSCQYIKFRISEEFRTSKFKLDELFQFFQKISNFGVFKEKCVYTIQKIGKKGHIPSKTQSLNIGFQENFFTDPKNSKFCLQNNFFIFIFNFGLSGNCNILKLY